MAGCAPVLKPRRVVSGVNETTCVCVCSIQCVRLNKIKSTVAHLAPSSGHCSTFSPTIPPLQVALSFACSVASLSHSPSFQLPGWHGLHHGSLADYLLGWGRTSTCTAGHTKLQCTTTPNLPCGLQEFPPSVNTSCAYGFETCAPMNFVRATAVSTQNFSVVDSLRGSSVKIGTIQRRLAWPLRKDDTHISRSVEFFL